MEYIEMLEKIVKKSNSGSFYAIYFPIKKEYVIVRDCVEADRYRKGSYNLAKKFTCEEEAIKWAKECKTNDHKIIGKKRFYGIYFLETHKGIILDSSLNLATTLEHKPSYCRKFSSKELALKWLEIVKKTNKDIDIKDIKKYENKLKSQELVQKYYVVYLFESQKMFITKAIEEAEEAVAKEEGLIKEFKKEKDAINWIIQFKNNQRIYYAIFFTEELKSIIAFDYEILKSVIKDKPNINKGFGTVTEADKWLKNIEYYYTEEMEKLLKEDTIFFDVGTGRGIGEEVRVSDFKGNSLLNKLEEYNGLINKYGNYNLGKIKNTSYGELYGLYLALLIALQNNIYKIAGDNQTVINQWSKGNFTRSKVLSYELELINKVISLRKEFEAKGGQIYYINANLNPADLGFHKNKKSLK